MRVKTDYNVMVLKYPLNRLLCWHGQFARRIDYSNNGLITYCAKCGRKRLGVFDFGSVRLLGKHTE